MNVINLKNKKLNVKEVQIKVSYTLHFLKYLLGRKHTTMFICIFNSCVIAVY